MKKKIALIALAAAAVGVQAADWSDTYLSYARGNKFAEPFAGNNISKNIYSLTHVSGYKYGTNFFNVDMLDSNSQDAAYYNGSGYSKTGAQEVYIVYRNTVDLSKVTGKSYTAPGVKGFGVTAGFDYNTKADNGYNSKKQMVVLGPTAFINVPSGFLNVSLLGLWESNSPFGYTQAYSSTNSGYGGVERYHYTPHASLSANWGIPVTLGVPMEFQGVANYIAQKGKSEYGGDTAAETYIDLKLMYDVSGSVGAAPKTFKVGAGYQYWKNKFGNPTTATVVSGSQAGPGATAKTPMIRAEYHF